MFRRQKRQAFKILHDDHKRVRTLESIRQQKADLFQSFPEIEKNGPVCTQFWILMQKEAALREFDSGQLSEGKCLTTLLCLQFASHVVEFLKQENHYLQHCGFDAVRDFVKAEMAEWRKRLRRIEAGSDESIFQLASAKPITQELPMRQGA